MTLLTDPLHLHYAGAYGSIEVVGRGGPLISTLVLAAAGVALAALWWLSAQGRLTVDRQLGGAYRGGAPDKAFAAQYLIWLVPFSV